jgi:hypothetical protein
MRGEVFEGNNTLTYVLPDVIDPPNTVCVTLHIPNNKFHIMAFKGAIWDLCNWWNWEKDDAHTATKVAQVWRRVFRAIQFVQCNPTVPQGTLVEINDMSDLVQVICDVNGNCILQYRCDVCDPWITAANLNQVNQPNQPGGSGTPQPAPNGGKACYTMKFSANEKFWLPAFVSTGDMVQVGLPVQQVSGTGNDGTDSALYCANGAVYGSGSCNSGGAHTVSTDPLNTSPHMTLLLVVNGVFYNITDNTVTIPGGVSNAQAYIQVNDQTLANCSGSYSGQVCVTNNQVGTFIHTFDFSLNDGAWLQDTQICTGSVVASYVVGIGWKNVNGAGGGCAPTSNYLCIYRNLPTTTITSIEVVYSIGTNPVNSVAVIDYNAALTQYGAALDGSVGNHDQLNSVTVSTNRIGIVLTSTANPCDWVIKQVIVKGHGADPF